MTFLTLLLVALVTWRITYMIQNEAGPWGVFSRLQAWIARRDDRPGSLADGFFCLYCLSVWVALPVAAIAEHSSLGSLFLLWLAASAGAILIDGIDKKLS